MAKFSFLLEYVDITDGTKMLSQTMSDEPTCAVQKTQVFEDFNKAITKACNLTHCHIN